MTADTIQAPPKPDRAGQEAEDRRRDAEREVDEGGRRPDDAAALGLVDPRHGDGQQRREEERDARREDGGP